MIDESTLGNPNANPHHHIRALVDSGDLSEADGYAILAAEALASAEQWHDAGYPDEAADFRRAAVAYARDRRAIIQSERAKIPDDLSSLDQQQLEDDQGDGD